MANKNTSEKNDITLREPLTFPPKRHTNKNDNTDVFCKPSSSGALRSSRASHSGATPATAGGRDRGDAEDGLQKSSLDIIFFGNGPLANYTLDVLSKHFNIIFHAQTKADLSEAAQLKHNHPDARAILASFGVLIREDFLSLFEPEGILNIHPSLLPKYRGPSPIETAILAGDQDFSLSIMKLVKAMDAGPVYYQTTLSASDIFSLSPPSDTSAETDQPATPSKDQIYHALATTGATWLAHHLANLPTPKPQAGTPTFTKKLDRSMSYLAPESQSALEMLNQLRAFLGFPGTKYTFFNLECTILDAHISPTFPKTPNPSPSAPTISKTSPITPDPSDDHLYTTKTSLALKCKDGQFFIIDRLQPAGKRPMDTRSFLNGYHK